MTNTTLEKIKAYSKTADKQDAMNALLDYYQNNDFNNLQCLCRSCHTIVHNKLRAEKRRIADEVS